jgi:hypothetical protein
MTTTTITTGIRPNGTGEQFARDLPEEVSDLCYRQPVPKWWGIRATDDDQVFLMLCTDAWRGYRISYPDLASGLTEWANQALTYIEDTPAHWLHNALYIAAGRWTAVDVDAADWCPQVLTYVAEGFGTQVN